MNALYYAAAAAYWNFIPQISGNFPRNYSGKVPLFFRKNSAEISELTTLVRRLLINYTWYGQKKFQEIG